MAPSVEWNTHLRHNFSQNLFREIPVHKVSFLYSEFNSFHIVLREFSHLLIIPPNVWEDSRSKIFQCKYVQSFNAGWYLSLRTEKSPYEYLYFGKLYPKHHSTPEPLYDPKIISSFSRQAWNITRIANAVPCHSYIFEEYKKIVNSRICWNIPSLLWLSISYNQIWVGGQGALRHILNIIVIQYSNCYAWRLRADT